MHLKRQLLLLCQCIIRHQQLESRYIPNFLLASELILYSDTLIVVLDQDDVLMHDNIVSSLKKEKSKGADLINGLMFRPNKPAKLYYVDYLSPRSKGGGNTWTHLRAFKKSLFDSVPLSEFEIGDNWIQDVSDYATMLPMTELAKNPVQMIDQYYIYHEREDYTFPRKAKQSRLIKFLLSQDSLCSTG